jgi:hypothetical protein
MKIGTLLNKPPVNKVYESTAALVLPKSHIGVEVELEDLGNLSYNSLDTRWTVKSDGSLHRNGMEFVFTEPLFGRDVVEALNILENLIVRYVRDYPMVVVVDQNTSVHVHVDARDVTPQELERWCKLYWLYEPVLFSFIGVDRELNPFCLPLDETKDAVANLWYVFEVLKGSGRGLASALAPFQRYSALNLAALNTFGSLEFRGHPGCYKADPILQWIDILLHIKRASAYQQIPYDRPYLALKEFGIESVTRLVFGKHAEDLLKVEDFDARINRGKSIVRYLANTDAMKVSLWQSTAFSEYIANKSKKPEEEQVRVAVPPSNEWESLASVINRRANSGDDSPSITLRNNWIDGVFTGSTAPRRLESDPDDELITLFQEEELVTLSRIELDGFDPDVVSATGDV